MSSHLGRSVGQGLGVVFVVLVLFVGIGPIVQFLYDYGLWRRLSVEEIQSFMGRDSTSGSYECREGSNGWDYICDHVGRPRGGRQSRNKIGIMGSPFGAVGYQALLPLDQPTPTPGEHKAGQAAEKQGLRAEQKRMGELLKRLDLKMARRDQLEQLPGVDRALARRIELAMIHKQVTTIDDLLTVEGVDRAMLEKIRPLVRVGHKE